MLYLPPDPTPQRPRGPLRVPGAISDGEPTAVPSFDVSFRRLPLAWVIASTAVALVAAGVVVLVFGGGDSTGDDSADAAAGGFEVRPEAELPPSVHDVALASLDGGDDRILHEYMDGKPIVVNFFASWCAPCLAEMPDFEQVHQDLGDQVTFLGLAYDDTNRAALDTVERTGVTYPTYADRGGAAMAYFEGIGMPTTVFLDPDGTVVDQKTGALDEAELLGKLSDHFGVS
jgi:cytochrome c biogenesis protein CcmG/thiol:disulfide interchange protein DsbE